MKKDAEVLRYMRERHKGTNQERAAARAWDECEDRSQV